MILYYILAIDRDTEDDLDLFVTARDDLEAVTLWERYFAEVIDGRPMSEFNVRLVKVPEAAAEPQAHSWHTQVTVERFTANIPGRSLSV